MEKLKVDLGPREFVMAHKLYPTGLLAPERCSTAAFTKAELTTVSHLGEKAQFLYPYYSGKIYWN